MDPSGHGQDLRARVRAASAWLDASSSELIGLAVLLAGGTVLAGVLWWWTPTSLPDDVPPPLPDAAAAHTGSPADDPAPPAGPGGELVVHVVGAVARPGTVRLPAGARVADALAAAGGASLVADLAGLNLARVLVDGEQVRVPGPGDPLGPAATGGARSSGGDVAGSAAALPDGRIDLNRATAADLETLPGVGPVLAGRIVSWRQEHGPFREVGQLREVSGIGERTFQGLADLVGVG